MSAITIVLLIVYLVVFGGGSVYLISKSMKSGSSAESSGDGFGSRIGFILSTIGMAVGVGAMWRFPMMCAQWGGGAFVLAFVIICVLIVIPAGFGEIAYARFVREPHISGFSKAVGAPAGKALGWMCGLDQLFLVSYYPAIMALVVVYFFKSFQGLDYASDPTGAEALFEATNGNRILNYALVVVILLVTGLVNARGISKGIEKVCKIMLPALFIILIILVIRVAMIPGIAEGIEYYIHPDWSQLLNPQMWAAAAGMALFAVGLGPGVLYAYGRFVKQDQDIAMDFVTVNVVQLFLCLMSGFIIIPAVKVFGMDPLMGKGIMFVALPKVFGTMTGGAIFMALFFLALLFAGLSSAISQLEVGMSPFMDKMGLNLTRKKATITCIIIAALVGIPCTWNDTFFAIFDNIVGNIGYCVGALCIALVVAWKFGAKKVREELYNPTSAIQWGSWIDYLYKYLVVIVMAYFSVVAIISLF